MVVCPEPESSRALEIVRSHALGKEAAIIGRVVSEHLEIVVLDTKMGGERIVETPSGEDLPRIC